MAKEKKAQAIEELQQTFSKCSVGILTDFKGLTALNMTNLRRLLRKSGIQYKVVKNTLARFAAERAGKSKLSSFFEGPIAIAFGFGDVVEPAKVLSDFIGSSKVSLSIKGGFLGDQVLTATEVAELARLPSREVLIARVLGGMQSPIVGLVSCLAAPLRGVMGVLQARAKQLEGK
jgi:large subunit ribosomal protein L10